MLSCFPPLSKTWCEEQKACFPSHLSITPCCSLPCPASACRSREDQPQSTVRKSSQALLFLCSFWRQNTDRKTGSKWEWEGEQPLSTWSDMRRLHISQTPDSLCSSGSWCVCVFWLQSVWQQGVRCRSHSLCLLSAPPLLSPLSSAGGEEWMTSSSCVKRYPLCSP